MDPNISIQTEQPVALVVETPPSHSQTNPKTKIRLVGKVFILIDLFLFLLGNLILLKHINDTCEELGCLFGLMFVFVYFPVLLVFFAGIIYQLYGNIKKKEINDFSRMSYVKAFRAFLIFTAFLIFICVTQAPFFAYYDQYTAAQIKANNIKSEEYYRNNVLIPTINKRIAILRTVQTALDKYYSKNKAYPFAIEKLALDGFLKEIPSDQNIGPEYYSRENLTQYTLCILIKRDKGRSARECVLWDHSTDNLVYGDLKITPTPRAAPTIIPTQSPPPATNSGGFYAHSIDGVCCHYTGGCDQTGCGNKCAQLVDDKFCNQPSPTP